MSIRHQALTMSLVALLLGAAVSTPSIAPANTHTAGAEKAGRKARKARKRLMRAIRRKGLASLPAVSGALASNGTTQGADVVGTPTLRVNQPSLVAEPASRCGPCRRAFPWAHQPASVTLEKGNRKFG